MPTMRAFKTALKHNQSLFNLLHPLHKAYRVWVMRAAQWRQGVDVNKVVFTSFQGRSYNDNPRYVSERLHALRPDVKIVWLFRENVIDKVQVPDYVKKVSYIAREGLIEQATAGFWVDNFRHAEAIYLNPKRQYYIQTWHGDRGFKRVGDDNEKLPFKVLRIENQCAMMIAGSEFGKGTYRTAFHFNGEVLMDGCPRNDLLLRNDPDQARAIRARLGVDGETGLMMYAPTYRDLEEHKAQKAVLDISKTLDHLEARTGRPWRCLYRAHYLNAGMIVRDDPRLIDACNYPEMAELLLVTDLLVTDYSSCGGDFALLRRPLFLYHADAEEYLRESRSFYFDIAKSPFLVAKDQAELEALIDRTDADAARANCEALDAFFGTTETGRASDAVCEYIFARMDAAAKGR